MSIVGYCSIWQRVQSIQSQRYLGSRYPVDKTRLRHYYPSVLLWVWRLPKQHLRYILLTIRKTSWCLRLRCSKVEGAAICCTIWGCGRLAEKPRAQPSVAFPLSQLLCRSEPAHRLRQRTYRYCPRRSLRSHYKMSGLDRMTTSTPRSSEEIRVVVNRRAYRSFRYQDR